MANHERNMYTLMGLVDAQLCHPALPLSGTDRLVKQLEAQPSYVAPTLLSVRYSLRAVIEVEGPQDEACMRRKLLHTLNVKTLAESPDNHEYWQHFGVDTQNLWTPQVSSQQDFDSSTDCMIQEAYMSLLPSTITRAVDHAQTCGQDMSSVELDTIFQLLDKELFQVETPAVFKRRQIDIRFAWSSGDFQDLHALADIFQLSAPVEEQLLRLQEWARDALNELPPPYLAARAEQGVSQAAVAWQYFEFVPLRTRLQASGPQQQAAAARQEAAPAAVQPVAAAAVAPAAQQAAPAAAAAEAAAEAAADAQQAAPAAAAAAAAPDAQQAAPGAPNGTKRTRKLSRNQASASVAPAAPAPVAPAAPAPVEPVAPAPGGPASAPVQKAQKASGSGRGRRRQASAVEADAETAAGEAGAAEVEAAGAGAAKTKRQKAIRPAATEQQEQPPAVPPPQQVVASLLTEHMEIEVAANQAMEVDAQSPAQQQQQPDPQQQQPGIRQQQQGQEEAEGAAQQRVAAEQEEEEAEGQQDQRMEAEDEEEEAEGAAQQGVAAEQEEEEEEDGGRQPEQQPQGPHRMRSAAAAPVAAPVAAQLPATTPPTTTKQTLFARTVGTVGRFFNGSPAPPAAPAASPPPPAVAPPVVGAVQSVVDALVQAVGTLAPAAPVATTPDHGAPAAAGPSHAATTPRAMPATADANAAAAAVGHPPPVVLSPGQAPAAVAAPPPAGPAAAAPPRAAAPAPARRRVTNPGANGAAAQPAADPAATQAPAAAQPAAAAAPAGAPRSPGEGPRRAAAAALQRRTFVAADPDADDDLANAPPLAQAMQANAPPPVRPRLKWAEPETMRFINLFEQLPHQFAEIKRRDAAHPDGPLLTERTQVDLKDKYKNLVKSGRVVEVPREFADR